MHRRTALSVSAALLAAAPLLTACGGESRPGAAAVVGGERIEVSSLQAQVRDVRTAQEASPQAAQLIQATGNLSREKLNVMIFDRVVDKVAADNGITASRGEIQSTRDEFTKQSGGAEQLAATLLQQQGVAPDQIDGVVRRTVLMNKIAAKLGIANTPEGQKKLMDVFTAASKDLKIDVNPRFGAWDDAKIQLGTFTAPWVRQISEEPTAVEAGA
ncbi:SurA N-terminal domain-containing protein [Streptomyces sp. P9(2023)]|uniref:SurA N-terminal domain-containing protein n=1 Tax=Streptomyces sp. P9(2023) TaxID=3064394 RepID=UPI0028F41959|nr:SurA N-terminal domain-containing protein [Streptomyces sp. P9(2023)]MDT9691147.1 SurA N-terminal domain-containing protein [Streptomyces sp. P9(2023)]